MSRLPATRRPTSRTSPASRPTAPRAPIARSVARWSTSTTAQAAPATSPHATMNDNPIWKMRVEGLKRHAHDNRWGREALRQWAQEGLMDEAPDVAAMIEQWPQRYTDLPPDAWPAALLPEKRG